MLKSKKIRSINNWEWQLPPYGIYGLSGASCERSREYNEDGIYFEIETTKYKQTIIIDDQIGVTLPPGVEIHFRTNKYNSQDLLSKIVAAIKDNDQNAAQYVLGWVEEMSSG